MFVAISADLQRLLALPSPGPHGVDNRTHFAAFFGQMVLRARGMCVINSALDNPMIFQHFEAIGQCIRCNSRQLGLQVRKSPGAMIHQLANNLAGPARPDDKGGPRNRTERKILLGHDLVLAILLDKI